MFPLYSQSVFPLPFLPCPLLIHPPLLCSCSYHHSNALFSFTPLQQRVLSVLTVPLFLPCCTSLCIPALFPKQQVAEGSPESHFFNFYFILFTCEEGKIWNCTIVELCKWINPVTMDESRLSHSWQKGSRMSSEGRFVLFLSHKLDPYSCWYFCLPLSFSSCIFVNRPYI